MANDIVQTIAEARVDARSLSEFVFKPAGFKVTRRLAPTVDTLQFYINRFNSLDGVFSSSVSVALSSLNNSVAEAEGKVAYIETTVQDAINNTAVEGGVLADTFVTVTANFTGAVARTQRHKNKDLVSVKDFGAKGDGITDDTLAIQKACDAGLGYVFIPSGKFTVSDSIKISSNTTLHGLGTCSEIISTGINKHCIYILDATDVTVSNLKIVGNETGTVNSGIGTTGGAGVRAYRSSNLAVLNCTFDKIGAYGEGSSSSIQMTSCHFITITGNRFLEDFEFKRSADIDIAYFCKQSIISSNISKSNKDVFISIAAVSSITDDVAHHVVSNNFGIRPNGSSCRHGVLVPYNGKVAKTTVTGNVLVNFGACGVYISAGETPVGTLSGGVTVTGNFIDSCGGVEGMAGITAGIYLSGFLGTSCVGNIVINTGYNLAGEKRIYDSNGISAINTSKNITIGNNVVRGSSGSNIYLQNHSGTAKFGAVIITGNITENAVISELHIYGSNSAAVIKDVTVTNNIFTNTTPTGNGVNLQLSSGFTDLLGFNFIGNNIIGAGKDVSNSVGLRFSVDFTHIVNIKNNSISGFNTGMAIGAFTSADKTIGNLVKVSGNTYNSCNVGMSAGLNTGKYAIVSEESYLSCTTDVSPASRVLTGEVISKGVYKIYSSNLPTDGVWNIGCRVVNKSPSVGSVSQWVATSYSQEAGTTWTPEITL